jgi:hypothetical protein
MNPILDLGRIVNKGITIARGGMYFVECIETMQTIITAAGMATAVLYAVGNYGYRSGKVVYSLFTNSHGQPKTLEINEDDVPDRFKCALTGKVMI